VTISTIAVDRSKALHVTLNLAAKIALDHDTSSGNRIGDPSELLIAQLSGADVLIDSGFLKNFRGSFPSDSIDIRKRRFDSLLVRDFDSK
jgi:hypothetical protein